MTIENGVTSPPKVAVIGAGAWGKNLIRNFAELGALEFICDSNLAACARATQSFPDVKTCGDFYDILRNPEITAVVIATPALTHYALAREALLAGKDVFVEKPLSLEAVEGRDLVDLANSCGRILMVGHILLYHPAIHKLKALIDTGELGKIQYVYSNRLNIGKIRSEENILWSFAPHDLSVILRLMGEMPQEVSVHSGSYLQTRIADVTLTSLSFANGVKGHIFVSWLHPFKEQMLVIIGDRQMAVFDDVSPDRKLVLYPHQIDWIERLPVARRAQGEDIPLEAAEPLRNECAHFLECVRTRRTPESDGNEGLRVLEVLQACQRSMDRGGAPVRLPESAPHLPYFVHESAIIDQPASIGAGTKIWHFSHILKDCSIGENCNIGQNVVIGPGVSIGQGCKIQNNISVYQGVTLEDNVFCGPSMVFTNVFNPRAHIRRMDEMRPTLVKTGATIGANATIVCGTTLGCYAFIGAGAVVTQNVPDYALMMGNPARQTGWMCACGIKLSDQLHCDACGKKYEKCATGLRELS